jgi:SAM-dependent methyltransferase
MSTNDTAAAAFNEFEATGWEMQAEPYDRFFGPITRRVVTEADLLSAARVTRGSRVLDVGTGVGHLAAACAAAGGDVVGVDIAEAMVRLARVAHPEVAFGRGDAEALPFNDSTFDAVLANFAILHVGRPSAAASEFARVLAPGGRVVLTTWDEPSRCRLAGVLVDAVARVDPPPPEGLPPGPGFFQFADTDAFTQLLAKAGLIDIQVNTVCFEYEVPDSAALWEGLLGGTVRSRELVRRQPQQVQDHIRAVFEELTADHAADGHLRIPVSVKVAQATRLG